MKNIFALGMCAVVLLAGTVSAQKPVTVGGAPMYPNKNIIENAVNSQDHTTLVAAVKAAGLVETLLKPESKGTLTAVLTYHVVSGRLNSQALARLIKQGKAFVA